MTIPIYYFNNIINSIKCISQIKANTSAILDSVEISINGTHPLHYKFGRADIDYYILSIDSNEFELGISNLSNDTLYLDYYNSYFMIDDDVYFIYDLGNPYTKDHTIDSKGKVFNIPPRNLLYIAQQ